MAFLGSHDLFPSPLAPNWKESLLSKKERKLADIGVRTQVAELPCDVLTTRPKERSQQDLMARTVVYERIHIMLHNTGPKSLFRSELTMDCLRMFAGVARVAMVSPPREDWRSFMWGDFISTRSLTFNI